MSKKIIILFLLSFLCLFHCKNYHFSHKITTAKYREKNKIDILNINSSNGNINIKGWERDTVEIATKKILLNGLANDLNLMDITFQIDLNKMIIATKIPARIEGKIDLDIYVPYILLNIVIESNNGNIVIKDFLGNIDITNNSGDLDINFQGCILRVNSNNSRLNVDNYSLNDVDMILNNQDGNIRLNIYDSGKISFFDLFSTNGNINLNISEDKTQEVDIITSNKNIFSNYFINPDIYQDGNQTFINYIKGKKKNPLKINVLNINGRIAFQELDNKNRLTKIF